MTVIVSLEAQMPKNLKLRKKFQIRQFHRHTPANYATTSNSTFCIRCSFF